MSEKLEKIAKLKKAIRKTGVSKSVLKMTDLEKDEWRIHVFNNFLQKALVDYLLKKGLNPEPCSEKYLGEYISVFETTPEFILLLRGNTWNYEKTKDYLLFHKRKGKRNDDWKLFSK